MANIEHKSISAGNIHPVPNHVVADAAALELLTFTSANVGDEVWQQDTNTYYRVFTTGTGSAACVILNATASPATQNNNSQLIFGGGVSYEGNLDFIVSAAVYQIVGVQYVSPQTPLTLAAADPTDPRIDALVLNTSGAAAIVKGTAATNPSLPSIDPVTQLLIGFVQIPANASSIAAAVNTLIYDENAGTPTEWAASALSGTWD